MKTEQLIDDTALPVVRTAIGRFFMKPSPPITPEDVDLFLPARQRYHETEVIRVAAFCGIWLFAATGCFLPWTGSVGWMIALRAVLCCFAWVPLWFVVIQLIIVVPGVLSVLLEKNRVLSKSESLALSTALAVLIFSIAACMLLVSPHLACRMVGGVWLAALALEGILRAALLVGKLRS
jgi:hypothetical protein